jgi:hypothetical protein
MRFIVKNITFDPGANLTPLKGGKYRIDSIKRAWVECEIQDGTSVYSIELIVEGISRGRFVTIASDNYPFDKSRIMYALNDEIRSALNLSKPALLHYKDSKSAAICNLYGISEKDFLGVMHKLIEIGGFDFSRDSAGISIF